MSSIFRILKLNLLVAIANVAAMGSIAYGESCEDGATYSPRKDYVADFFMEAGPRLKVPMAKLSNKGLLPWILKGRPAPKRIVFFTLNPRRGDLIIDFLPDIAVMRKLYPSAKIVLLSPHSELMQKDLSNFTSISLQNATLLARQLYDSYINMNAEEINKFNEWNFEPLFAELKTYLNETTMVVTNSDLQPLIQSARERRYEEVRRNGRDLTHLTFFTSWFEMRMNDRFEEALERTLLESESAGVMTNRWLKTVNIGTDQEKLWSGIQSEYKGRIGPINVRDFAYDYAQLMRDINYGSSNVDFAPKEFFVSKKTPEHIARYLRTLPENFVLINLNKGEERRLNQVETQSALFLDKLLARLKWEYPHKKFVLIDLRESWRTSFESAQRPDGEWMKAVMTNRHHLMALSEKYGAKGWFTQTSVPDTFLPYMIERAEAVITQDSGFSHTATSILGQKKVLMLSVDDMGLKWAAPNQPTVYDIESWARITPGKLDEILSQIKLMLKSFIPGK